MSLNIAKKKQKTKQTNKQTNKQTKKQWQLHLKPIEKINCDPLEIESTTSEFALECYTDWAENNVEEESQFSNDKKKIINYHFVTTIELSSKKI